MNESEPWNPAFGVYVTEAVSVSGVPGAQELFAIDPSEPLAGPATIENVNSHESGSEPWSVTGTATP